MPLIPPLLRLPAELIIWIVECALEDDEETYLVHLLPRSLTRTNADPELVTATGLGPLYRHRNERERCLDSCSPEPTLVLLRMSHVCGQLRRSLIPHPLLWARAIMVKPGPKLMHIFAQRASPVLRLCSNQLLSNRAVAVALLYIHRASAVRLHFPKYTDRKTLWSETLYYQFYDDSHPYLEDIDIRFYRQPEEEFIPEREVELPSLKNCRILNSPLKFFGDGMRSLHIAATAPHMRSSVPFMCSLLRRCRGLEKLALQMALSADNDTHLSQHSPKALILPQLCYLSLCEEEQLTFRLLQQFDIPPTCAEAHLDIIFPMGFTLNQDPFDLQTLLVSLEEHLKPFLSFRSAAAYPVVVIELLLDMDCTLRFCEVDIREWPEALVLTQIYTDEAITPCISNIDRVVSRHESPRRSLTVRNAMSSSRPMSFQYRRHPLDYPPTLEDFLLNIMGVASAKMGLRNASQVIIPPRSYYPATVRGWAAMLRSMTCAKNLIVCGEEHEWDPMRLADYLAQATVGGVYPLPELRLVYLPYYQSQGRSWRDLIAELSACTMSRARPEPLVQWMVYTPS